MYKTSAQEALQKFSRARLMKELIRGGMKSMDVIRSGLGMGRKAKASPVKDMLSQYAAKGRAQGMHPSRMRLLDRKTSKVPLHSQLGSSPPGTFRPAAQSAMVYRNPVSNVHNAKSLGPTIAPGRRLPVPSRAPTVYAR